MLWVQIQANHPQKPQLSNVDKYDLVANCLDFIRKLSISFWSECGLSACRFLLSFIEFISILELNLFEELRFS